MAPTFASQEIFGSQKSQKYENLVTLKNETLGEDTILQVLKFIFICV